MANTLIGVVVTTSGRMLATLKLEDDSELDNPVWLTFGNEWNEEMRMVRLTRAEYEAFHTREEFEAAVAREVAKL
jgi:hypothetical protein